MAKNLYNLTAVTTVNDSDLLHVNQGSVSSDKKVTKQNLLKEVNSSISSINNSLTKSSVAFTKHASITDELIQCHKLANVLYISGYFKVSSTVSSGAVLLDIPSISNYVLQYIFIHNASNQVSARLETASNSGHLCIKVSTAISGSEYHYISCAIVL